MQYTPIEYVIVPVTKIKEVIIPHHQRNLDAQKSRISKLLQNQYNYENIDENRKTEAAIIESSEKQLETLIFELTELSRHVHYKDLVYFEELVSPLRRSILNITRDYSIMKKNLKSLKPIKEIVNTLTDSSDKEFKHSFQQQQQIKIRKDARIVRDVEYVENEVINLHELISDFNRAVHEQGEDIDQIEANFDAVEENVESGLKQLITASRYKRKLYPVTGAVIGTVCGGPVGFLAGLKIGIFAALGCGVLGYTGGKIIHKCDEHVASQHETKEE